MANAFEGCYGKLHDSETARKIGLIEDDGKNDSTNQKGQH